MYDDMYEDAFNRLPRRFRPETDDEHKRLVRAAMVDALTGGFGPEAGQFGAAAALARSGADQIGALINQLSPDISRAAQTGPGTVAPDVNMSSYEPDLPVPSPRAAPPVYPDETQAEKTLEEQLEKVTREQMRTGRPALGQPPRRRESKPPGDWPIETCGFLPSAGGKATYRCVKGGEKYFHDLLVINAWRDAWGEGDNEAGEHDYPLFNPRGKAGKKWGKGKLSGRSDEVFLKFRDVGIPGLMEVMVSGQAGGLELLKPGARTSYRYRDKKGDLREVDCYRPPKGAYEYIGPPPEVFSEGSKYFYYGRETVTHTHDGKKRPEIGPDDGVAARVAASGVAYMMSKKGAFRIKRDAQGNYSAARLVGEWGAEGGEIERIISDWQEHEGKSRKSRCPEPGKVLKYEPRK